MRLAPILATGLVVAVVYIGLTVLIASDRIHASCGPHPSPEEAFEEASVVFYGEVIAKRKVASDWGRQQIQDRFSNGKDTDYHFLIEFKAQSVWKGPVTETIFINTLANTANWGGWPWFEVGSEYFIYAHGTSNEPYAPHVWLCDRILEHRSKEDFDALGPGMKPDPETSAATPTPITPSLSPTPDPPRTRLFGDCNSQGHLTRIPIDSLPLALVAGVALIRLRKNRRR